MTSTHSSAPRIVRPSAYFLLRATLYSGFVMIPISIVAVALAIFDFRLFVANPWIAIVFVLSIASVRLCAIGSDLQVSTELDRGYTSLLQFGNEVDVRDPRDGRLVRAAGQPFRRSRTMKLARERAANFEVSPSGTPGRIDAELSIIREPESDSGIRSFDKARPSASMRRLWVAGVIIILIATFVVRQLITASQTSGYQVLAGIAIALAFVGLVVGVPILVSGQSIESRVTRIRSRDPDAFIVPSVRTVSLVGLLSRLLPDVTVPVDQCWTFDSAGCSLWLGKTPTGSAILIPWVVVQSVDRVSAHSDKGNTYPAVAITFLNSNKTEDATFFPRRTGALTLFRMSAEGIDHAVGEIRLVREAARTASSGL